MPSSNIIDKEITIVDIIKKLEIIKERQAVYDLRVQNKNFYAFQFFGHGFGCSAQNKLEATNKIIAKTEALIAILNDNPKSLNKSHLDFSLSDCNEKVKQAATEKGTTFCSYQTRKLGDDFEDLIGVIDRYMNGNKEKIQPTNDNKTSKLDSGKYNMYSFSSLGSQTSSRATSTLQTSPRR